MSLPPRSGRTGARRMRGLPAMRRATAAQQPGGLCGGAEFFAVQAGRRERGAGAGGQLLATALPKLTRFLVLEQDGGHLPAALADDYRVVA